MKTQSIHLFRANEEEEQYLVIINHAETSEEYKDLLHHLLKDTDYSPKTLGEGYTVSCLDGTFFVVLAPNAQRITFFHELVHVAERIAECEEDWSKKQQEELKADLIPSLVSVCGLWDMNGAFDLNENYYDIRFSNKKDVKVGWDSRETKKTNQQIN